MGLLIYFCSTILLFFIISGIGISQTIVIKLPGFDEELPFSLETGYVGVGESNESQLFYYFVESLRSPAEDPLVLWLTGGPGCSCLSAFFFASGPLAFNYAGYNGSLPSLHLNPQTWTKGLNILYVDAPVGTGFSYSTTQEGYYMDDYKHVAQTTEFLRKWLLNHPQFLTNILYIGGDSYSGIPLPAIVQEVVNGNEAGVVPYLNIKGYILGNPKTDVNYDLNSRIPFAHRLTIISDELYESVKESCNGDYLHINENNTQCVADIAAIAELTEQINQMQVLEPTCQTASPKPELENQKRRLLQEHYYTEDFLSSQPTVNAFWCRDYNYNLLGIWANHESVRKALNVREGTVGVWKRCNSSLAYTYTIYSSVEYHRNLSNTNLRALIYSGDHDMSIPNIGTQYWIHLLNLTVDDAWRPWYVDGQVAGYTERFTHNNYNMIFATVKGAGHVAVEYKPTECYSMVDRWFAYYPL